VAAGIGTAAAWTQAAPNVDIDAAWGTRGSITHEIAAAGTLQAVSTVDVSAPLSGLIQSVDADWNASVHAGDILARIDAAPYEAELRSARAALAAALADPGEAEPAVRAAEEAVTRAQVAVERTVIRCPVDGVVVLRSVEVGENVDGSPQAPVLFRIASDLRHLQLIVDVNASDMSDVRAGERVTFTVEPFGDALFTGELIGARQASAGTAVADVPNLDQRLRPGMSATVTILGSRHDDVTRVPLAAFDFQPPAEAASMIDDFGDVSNAGTQSASEGVLIWKFTHGRLTPVAVRIGLTGGEWAELVAGPLQPDDQVATGARDRRDSWWSRFLAWMP
jgi:HlyD family secretion protein